MLIGSLKCQVIKYQLLKHQLTLPFSRKNKCEVQFQLLPEYELAHGQHLLIKCLARDPPESSGGHGELCAWPVIWEELCRAEEILSAACSSHIAAAPILQLTRDTRRVKMTCGDTEVTNSNKRSAPRDVELNAKKAKIEVTLASSEAGQLTQIESEFQILKSLIPEIANRQQINEVCFYNKSLSML